MFDANCSKETWAERLEIPSRSLDSRAWTLSQLTVLRASLSIMDTIGKDGSDLPGKQTEAFSRRPGKQMRTPAWLA
jgi:hypothetical protein